MSFTTPPTMPGTHPGFGHLDAEGLHNPFRAFDFDKAERDIDYGGWKHVFKEAPEQAKAFHTRFKHNLRRAHPAIMVPGHALRGILESGSIKSQFQTGTSGGVESRQARASAEKQQFGYPLDHPDHARPLYGYLTQHPYTDDSVSTWGPHTIMLDEGRVAHRTTFTGHDSLDPIAHVTPHPINRYRRSAVPLQTVGLYAGDTEDAYEPGDIGEHMRHRDPIHDADRYWAGERDWGARYPEAQYHGGLHLGDVSHVILRSPHSGQMSEDATEHAAALTRAGIPWVHTGRFVAPTGDDPWFNPRMRK